MPGIEHFVSPTALSYGLYKLSCSLVRFRFVCAADHLMKLCGKGQKYAADSLETQININLEQTRQGTPGFA